MQPHNRQFESESARQLESNAVSRGKLTKPLRGIDVSSYQGKINWQIVTQDASFIFIKATEGAGLVDSHFASNIRAAREAKTPCGACHYFRPKTSVAKQARNFIKTVGSLQPGDLPPVLVLEYAQNWNDVSVARRIRMIERWVGAVSVALGCSVTLYMSAAFAQDISLYTKELSKFDLWVADYTQEDYPLVPKVWMSWTFWQYTSRGRVEGIETAVDLDLFNGTREQLDKFRFC
jgi:lysozyme